MSSCKCRVLFSLDTPETRVICPDDFPSGNSSRVVEHTRTYPGRGNERTTYCWIITPSTAHAEIETRTSSAEPLLRAAAGRDCVFAITRFRDSDHDPSPQPRVRDQYAKYVAARYKARDTEENGHFVRT